MKNEILNTIKQSIPDKPYILFIGTSHTYGECDGKHIESYAVHLSKMMGMECVNFGFSGAQNFELLQIVNELHMIDAFNENCKMVILEPRLTDNTTQIQYETWTEHLAIIDSFDATKDHNNPLIMKTAFGNEMHPERNWISECMSVNDNLYRTVQQEQLNWNEFKEIISDYYVRDGRKKIDRFALDQELKAAEQTLAMESKTLATAFDDYMIVDSIKNMIVNKGIPFHWLMIDYRDHHLELINYIYGECTDLTDYLLFGKCAKVALSRYSGTPQTEIDVVLDNGGDPCNLNGLLCKCYHLNPTGNKKLAEIIYQELTGDDIGR